MRNLISKLATSKPAIAVSAAIGTAVTAFAEGTTGGGSVTAGLVTEYIDSGKTEIVTVLTSGAAIVGAFFVWGLIKKALNRSK